MNHFLDYRGVDKEALQERNISDYRNETALNII